MKRMAKVPPAQHFRLEDHPAPETAGLTLTAMIALYHRTAPAQDVAFIVRQFPELALQMPARPSKADASRAFQYAREALNARARAKGQNPYANEW